MATENILQMVKWKIDRLKTVNIQPKGILLPAGNYQELKDELKSKGIAGNPDRLMNLPLYTPDPEKMSDRIELKEPMVIY